MLTDNVVDTKRTGNTTGTKRNRQLHGLGEVSRHPALQNAASSIERASQKKEKSQIVPIALLYFTKSPPHSFWLSPRARQVENLNIEIAYYCCVTTEFKTS